MRIASLSKLVCFLRNRLILLIPSNENESISQNESNKIRFIRKQVGLLLQFCVRIEPGWESFNTKAIRLRQWIKGNIKFSSRKSI